MSPARGGLPREHIVWRKHWLVLAGRNRGARFSTTLAAVFGCDLLITLCFGLTIPVLTLQGRLRLAAILALVVLGEVIVLAVNRWRCPLTPIAARYTDDRRANFDIYLPEWLARYNKEIFGPLYLAGVLLLVVRWAVAA